MSAAFDAHSTKDADYVLSREEFYALADASHAEDVSHELALVYLRIANMKNFNTLRGIEMGDKVLHFVAHQIAQTASAGLVARYAVDSFMFVCPHQMVEPIVSGLNAKLPTFGEVNGLEAKAGYIVRRPYLSAEDGLERAKFACDAIRFKDGVYCQVFAGELETSFDKRAYVVERLDDAIANHEIRVYAQPIVRLLTGRICEVESLARWESPEYGFLRPDEFVPELERQQLIHKLDAEVIRLACEQWAEAANAGINVPFGINLSRLDFELCDIFEVVTSAMARYNVPTDQVHIEITESATSSNEDIVRAGAMRFAEAGFEIYLDDYGSGYSSLEVLENYPFKVVKLDMSLVRQIEYNEHARVIVSDTIAMVKRLGMQALCEGIETEEQLEFLRAVGCEKGQGYLFAKPLSHEQAMERLQENSDHYEEPEDRSYLDAIGLVNLVDGSSADLHGVEAAHFFGREPLCIVEIVDGEMRILASNVAYQRMLDEIGLHSFEGWLELARSGAGEMATSAVFAARTAAATRQEQSFDFVYGDYYVSVYLTYVANSDERFAVLVRCGYVKISSRVTDAVLLNGVLDSIDRNIFWKDSERRFLGANQSFLDYYGFEGVEEIIGKTDEDMGWHVDDEPFRSDELSVLSGGFVSRARGTCMRKGELRDIEASKRPLFSNGSIVGLVGYFEDRGPHASEWD